ncbi:MULTISPECIES: hypothetical protein [Leptolyngbya]|uniref:hypothetical protein n=1 Tax=Leptolyngbya TaxID=47251 RepID=UPI001682FCCC|nr:hypothetical protein [Leptolyngbya sp. FACHB-1624]MBD1857697.1 hypothetical protein [Leptolyngbya sp. FACHB-1624]
MRRSLKFLGVLIALSVVTIQPTITQAQPSSELINPAVPYVPTPEEVVMGMLSDVENFLLSHDENVVTLENRIL